MNLDSESWKAFLRLAVEPGKYEESCAWLFCDKPFCDDHTVYVFPVKNIGLKGYTTRESFAPEKKSFQQVKKIAKKKQLTKIGLVHTHVLASGEEPDDMDYDDFVLPSDEDLKFARRFNNVIRGIVMVVFAKDGQKGILWNVVWHDQFGNILNCEKKAVLGEIDERKRQV